MRGIHTIHIATLRIDMCVHSIPFTLSHPYNTTQTTERDDRQMQDRQMQDR